MRTVFTSFLFICFWITLSSQTLPDGFVQTVIGDGLDPTTMTQLPDGRLLIAEKSGKIRVVENDVLLEAPMLDIEVETDNERGLLGLVADPDFPNNGYIYIYYTLPTREGNQISRFTVSGNTADPDSETLIFSLDNFGPGSDIHNGGAMVFGLDGKLYVAIGDGAESNKAQQLDELFGKILRINPDGSIPEDNPFYDKQSGPNRAIWALGLRNPFTLAVQPGTGLIYANDVGESGYEEVNDIRKGKNYGWPFIEGPSNGNNEPDDYMDPVHAYDHDEGCSIIGASFYNPGTYQFPERYRNKFFFGDYCDGYIKVLDPLDGNVFETFATGIDQLVAIYTSQNGDLYYLDRRGIGDGSVQDNTSTSNGRLWKVTYAEGQAPVISQQPNDAVVSEGEQAVFSIQISGTDQATYQWYVNDVAIDGATADILTLENVSLNDNGSTIYCVVTYPGGTLTSDTATLTVSTNQRPVVTITNPVDQGLYEAGDTIQFSGTVVDAEDGEIDSENWTWQIDFHHDEHIHPGLDPTSGITEGTYIIPTLGHNATSVWYRFYLSGSDYDGLSQTTYVEIFPKLIDITFTSFPEGIDLFLEGRVVTTPLAINSVVGIERPATAPETVEIDGRTYKFQAWHTERTDPNYLFRADSSNLVVTAFYEPVPVIIQQPASVTTSDGGSATFTVGTDPATGTYQWYENGEAIPDANSASLTIDPVSLDMNGSTYYVEITFADTVLTSDTATLTIEDNENNLPNPQIILPVENERYVAGDTIFFIGYADDVEDGEIPSSEWVWQVEFIGENGPVAIDPNYLVDDGGYIIPPVTGRVDGDAIYRFTLIVTDQDEGMSSVSVDVLPLRAQQNLASVPSGLSLSVNGDIVTTPYQWDAIVGHEQIIMAEPSQTLNDKNYAFSKWQDDSESLTYTFFAEEEATTLTATYTEVIVETPVIIQQPGSITVTEGNDATFTIVVDPDDQVTYQWFLNGDDAPEADGNTFTIPNATIDDDGIEVYCVVFFGESEIVSNTAVLTVLPNAGPTVQISQPTTNSNYQAGQPVNFEGTANDPEEGAVPAANFTWEVFFHRGGAFESVYGPESGITSGSFTPAAVGFDGDDAYYRIQLTVADQQGKTSTTSVDVRPERATVQIMTNPNGLNLNLDSRLITAPYTFEGIVGTQKTLEVAPSQVQNNVLYVFTDWQDESTTTTYDLTVNSGQNEIIANYIEAFEIIQQPQSTAVESGQDATFTIQLQANTTLSYQWFVNGDDVAGADGPTLTIPAVNPNDNGTVVYCVITVGNFTYQSESAILTVISDNPPVIESISPEDGSFYRAGDEINFTAQVTDTEDQEVDLANWEWTIDFHKDGEIIPAMTRQTGIRSGSYKTPTVGHTGENVWYRVNLVVTDSDGRQDTASVDLFPVRADFSIQTNPSGMNLNYNGRSITTPFNVNSIVGLQAELTASAIQESEGQLYVFDQWHNGTETLRYNGRFLENDTLIVANYLPLEFGSGTGLKAYYYRGVGQFDGSNLMFTQVDPTISFDWQSNGPQNDAVQADRFSVIWNGFIEPQVDGLHTFKLIADDGARLLIDDQVILDQWDENSNSELNGQVELQAGQQYPIQVLYYEMEGNANCQLTWSTAKLPEQIIPMQQLYPNDLATSTEDQLPGLKLHLFPTPTVNQINIRLEYPETVNLQFSLINELGQMVKNWEEHHPGNEMLYRVDVRDLPNGLYLLRTSIQGKSHLEKIIKN